jgi:hypothetical protein
MKRQSFWLFALTCLLLIPWQVNASLVEFFSETGPLSISVDATGSNEAVHSIDVEKPDASATVRAAYVLAASYSRPIFDGDITINGTPISWQDSVSIPWQGDLFYNVLADTTAVVKPVIDAAPVGRTAFSFTEIDTNVIDGEALVVVFDDATQPQRTISLLFGAQQLDGDRFAITLAEPIDPNGEGSKADFGLGISYSYQPQNQFSLVEVNGTRITTSAGGYDDGVEPNGTLITVGGLDDSNENPADPFITDQPGGSRTDDELYSLLPLISETDTSISVFTENPSDDDNIFFAYFVLSGAAVIGEGIVLGPEKTNNLINTDYTAVATLVDDNGNFLEERQVTFNVVNGPNMGVSNTTVTGRDGKAYFTYAGNGIPGIDVIQASFRDSTQTQIESNLIMVSWEEPLPVEFIFLESANATMQVGNNNTIIATLSNDKESLLAGREVTFKVVSGPNTGFTSMVITDANGKASFSYAGNGGIGIDNIQASFVDAGQKVIDSNLVTIEWQPAPEPQPQPQPDPQPDPQPEEELLIKLDWLTASAVADGILVEWETAIEMDTIGFYLWRARKDQYGGYTEITLVTPQYIPTKGKYGLGAGYSYIDPNVEAGKVYYYAVQDIDNNGKMTFQLDKIGSAQATAGKK